jgi:hypothetical protein
MEQMIGLLFKERVTVEHESAQLALDSIKTATSAAPKVIRRRIFCTRPGRIGNESADTGITPFSDCNGPCGVVSCPMAAVK